MAHPKPVYSQKLSLQKFNEPAISFREKITGSKECYQIAKRFWDIESIEITESFNVLYLNKQYQTIAWAEISRGGIDGTVADTRIIFAHGILARATAMILFHNHPSGNLKPSDADISLTKKLKKAGKILHIQVLDHLIVTAVSYYSFADEYMI